jgi:hypothetical protein
MQLVYQNIDTAQEQIRRSHQLVAHSRQIVAQVNLTLAHARRIQNSTGPASLSVARGPNHPDRRQK